MRAALFSVWILTALSLLTACSTAQKRAQEQMEHENFEEAAQTYEGILRRNPGDADAASGLKEARFKILDKKLIDVRKARSAGNPAEAAEVLLDVISREKAWGQRPRGAAVFTQQEETEAAATSDLSRLRDMIGHEKPLKAETLLRAHAPLYEETKTQSFAELKARTRRLGQAECRTFAKESYGDKPYLAEFVNRYCAFFGEKATLRGYDRSDKNSALLREIKLSGEVKQLPPEIRTELANNLNQAIRGTPWYSADGKQALTLALAGEFLADQNRTPTQLVYQYSETEHYVDYRDVTKTRQVPFEATDFEKNGVTGATTPVQRIKYRPEQYTEKEPYDATRSIEKTFPYGAWKITQSLKLGLEGQSQLAGRNLSVAVNDESHTEDTESDADMPQIGLRPKAAQAIPNRLTWLRQETPKLTQDLTAKLVALWSDLYCNDIGKSELGVSGNRARQCLRLGSAAAQPPKSVDDWHLQFVGLPTRAADTLLAQ